MTRIEECIDQSLLDLTGLWSLLKKDCVTCNVNQRKDKKTRCQDCPFIFNSTYYNKNEKKKRSRIGCGSKFKQYGLKKASHVGKHQLYFFLSL